MRTGVIGYGYWGPNLVRTFSEGEGADVTWCVDQLPNRVALAKKCYTAPTISTDPEAIFTDSTVDAVVVATPLATHFTLVKGALERDKHVPVERPVAAGGQRTTV